MLAPQTDPPLVVHLFDLLTSYLLAKHNEKETDDNNIVKNR